MRGSVRIIAGCAALAAALAGLTASSSAQTCGAKLCLDVTHSPAAVEFVSPSSLVTYTVTVSNPGTSTATKVVLQDALPTSATLVSTLPAGCSLSTNVITCSLGSVKPTGAAPRVFRFTVRMPSTSGITSSTASVSSDARASDAGNNPNDPTVESFSDAPELVEVRAVEGVANSDVPNGIAASLDTDPDGTGATTADPQTAKLNLLARGFSTTAEVNDDVPDSHFVCPDGLKCPRGGWLQAVVPGPLGVSDPFTPPSEFKIELRHDASRIPTGLTPNKYVLLHDLDYNESTTGYEQIKRSCSSNPAPCLIKVRKLEDGDFLITALVEGNWRYR